MASNLDIASAPVMECGDCKDKNAFASIMRTGRELCSKMKFRQAMTCYRTVLNFIKDDQANPQQPPMEQSQGETSDHSRSDESAKTAARFEEMVFYYCEALACAVEMSLHLKDVDGARLLLTDYQYPVVFSDSIFNALDTDKVKYTLGNAYLAVGRALIEGQCMTSAKDNLKMAKYFLYDLSCMDTKAAYAEVLGLLGFCCLMHGNPDTAVDTLLDSIELWRKLNYPLHQIELCVNAMKHYIESKLKLHTPNVDDHNVCTDMLRLHKALWNRGLNNQIPEAFYYLGYIAFKQENEKTSLAFFEEALALYRQMPQTDAVREEILKLLKDIGVASYNCRKFSQAASAYKDCLDLLRSQPGSGSSSAILAQVAECCAALGFTYSRLRNFDKMLEYYETALELQNTLVSEDLELIETNIGSLYHVKAVLAGTDGNEAESNKYFTLAEAAFLKALKYSWKSFPFINYGYYLLCRKKYLQASHVLQQGFVNGRIDKDTVEFDHTEDPILLDDLKRELEGVEDIRMPSTIIALYLKVIRLSSLHTFYSTNDVYVIDKSRIQLLPFLC